MTDFEKGYIDAALWTGFADPQDDAALDEYFTRDDIPHDVLLQVQEDCHEFCELAKDHLAQAYDFKNYSEEMAGHDFLLTRNRHGAGFWDRGLGDVGRKLTDIAHTFGETHWSLGNENTLIVL